MTAPARRTARCNCGALAAETTGEPIRVAMCSCDACQRRTGSAFAYSSFWKSDQVRLTGTPTRWSRNADSGQTIEHFFCPTCGTVLWSRGRLRDVVNIAAGCFADGDFPPPQRAVWTARRHGWVETIAAIPAEPEQPR
ncbi:MAG: GFA family protein [Acuticoccus sp.]